MTSVTIEDLQNYYDKLASHDWTFDYSDDGMVWRRGRAEHDYLRGMATKHPECDELFRAYADHVWRQKEKPARPN